VIALGGDEAMCSAVKTVAEEYYTEAGKDIAEMPFRFFSGPDGGVVSQVRKLTKIEGGSKLLLLDPACVGPYDGCDENGASMRRYALAAPAPVVEEAEEEEEEDSEEEDAFAQEEMQRRIAELLLSTQENDSSGRKKLTEEEIERRKKEAEEMGERARTLSKAERAELNKTRKEKAGHRQAKTGASARKFEGEGAVSKEEKKKRQAANVNKRFGLA